MTGYSVLVAIYGSASFLDRAESAKVHARRVAPLQRDRVRGGSWTSNWSELRSTGAAAICWGRFWPRH